jgi:serine/threonine protein kinase
MLQAHHRLGEFEIVRLLGKGGMGEVYEAQQDSPRRRVALKVLAPWLAENEEALARFWREAEVPAQLNHPHIVRIISTGQTEGVAYYTMHLVQGISLAEMIRSSRSLCAPTVSQPDQLEQTPSAAAPPAAAHEEAPDGGAVEGIPSLCLAYLDDRYRALARIGVMVARALAYAHSRGCVHRDLKPANIMVDQHDHAYVMDFGLTRALEPDGVYSTPGNITGTPWYMSPEQARGETVDHRSDIYSLGVTLYELATQGTGPYPGTRQRREAVLAQVEAGQLLPLRSLAPNIPPALERIILKAMSYRPQRRHADAGQLAQDLERFLEQPSPSTTGQGDQPPQRRSKAKLLGGAFALLALAALGVFIARGGIGGTAPPPGKGDVGNTSDENELAVPKDYPDQLRNRPWKVSQALFTVEHAPVWHRSLAGTGQFMRQSDRLGLTSPSKDEHPTLIALDDDPKRRWFEFAVEVNAPLDQRGKYRPGVFFGWRKTTSRFFVVEVDEHPLGAYPNGVARIGTLRLIEGGGAEPPSSDFRWLVGEKGLVPLPKNQDWHHLLVRAVDDRITLTVDGLNSSHFTMDWLGQNHPDDVVSLNPRGALGIWAFNAPFAVFRNASVTALPSGENDKTK